MLSAMELCAFVLLAGAVVGRAAEPDPLSTASLVAGVKRALLPAAAERDYYDPTRQTGIDVERLLAGLVPDGWREKFEEVSGAMMRSFVDTVRKGVAAGGAAAEGSEEQQGAAQSDSLDVFPMCADTRALCDYVLCEMRNFQRTGRLSDVASLSRVLRVGRVRAALSDPAFVGSACAESAVSPAACELFTQGVNLLKSFVGFLLPQRHRRQADSPFDVAGFNGTEAGGFNGTDTEAGGSNGTESGGEEGDKSLFGIKRPGKPPVEAPFKPPQVENCAAIVERVDLLAAAETLLPAAPFA